MTEQEQPPTKWRRSGPQSWRRGPTDGDLGEDGTMLFAFRTDVPDERCPVCRRRGLHWRVDLGLPSPFPSLGTAGRGCSREHAADGAPMSWAEVACHFAALAAAVRRRVPFTEWDARHADMRARQAARAARLSGWDRPARGLALRLWADDPRLTMEATEAILTGVLSAPIQRPNIEPG